MPRFALHLAYEIRHIATSCITKFLDEIDMRFKERCVPDEAHAADIAMSQSESLVASFITMSELHASFQRSSHVR